VCRAIGILAQQEFNDLIPRGLPATRFARTGSITGISDAGIVFPAFGTRRS
jgi:hypothetical protein